MNKEKVTSKEEKTAIHQAEVKTMLSQTCPIAKTNCNMECVHFNIGGVVKVPNFLGNGEHWVCISPSCRLWK